MMSELTSETTPAGNQKIFIDTAEPPPEIEMLLKNHNGADLILGWAAVPVFKPPEGRVPISEIMKDGQIDAVKILKPFLGNVILNQTLRTVDVLNGCAYHCDTCLADSAYPSRIFSTSSLEALFANPDFIRMLQPDSLRFGSSGDVLNHPDGPYIIKLALTATEDLDRLMQSRTTGWKRDHTVKVFTNYRHNTEQQLDSLLDLAIANARRLQVIISLPFNRVDTVNHQFFKYIQGRPEIFRGTTELDEIGVPNFYVNPSKHRNISVFDVRHPMDLYTTGRTLPHDEYVRKIRHTQLRHGGERVVFYERGMAKIYLNPDALWLQIYATHHESHTERVFTPLTAANISVLSHVPFHQDFHTPPNWPGGRGVRKDDVRRDMEELESNPIKRSVIVR